MSEYHLLVQAGGRENEIIAYPDKVSVILPKHGHSRLYARVDIDVVRVLVIPPQTSIEGPMTLTERMRHLGVGDERLGPEIGFHGLPPAVGEIQRLVRSEFEKFQKHIFVIPSKENARYFRSQVDQEVDHLRDARSSVDIIPRKTRRSSLWGSIRCTRSSS